MRPEALLAICRESHRRFLDSVMQLDDDALRRPSRLPGWSRGHVVAHVVNKASAHVVLFGGPARGEVRHLYPPGHDQDAAAAAGSGRSRDEFAAALREAFVRLEDAWDRLPEPHWAAMATMTAGERTLAEVVSHHLRNVEVHHVDLGAGYQAADWPALFVETELAKRLRDLSACSACRPVWRG